MLTPHHRSTLTGFIIDSEEGVITGNADIRYCKVTFDIKAYSDAAFAQYGRAFPAHLSRAVAKRKAEYLAGRFCCARALAPFSITQEVTKNSDRSPCWPRGMSGTISHGDNQAVALVTRQPGVSPGIDIESFNPAVLREIADSIVTPAEAALLASLPIDTDVALLLAFSAKESLFKALYPSVQVFFGFDYARVESIDEQEQRFVLRLTQDINARYRQEMTFDGRYLFDGKHIVTLIVAT
ncbi:4'-phosphopantetheinyl transferase family protein [Rouxiella chamberiensis]|uniref:Enterobactin synthase component D n=1 Tax=Rouxiella chamberiensis TaxID=1513468 RepID=A0ABY7HRX9_9GAMM|nr:4'-phosphopantetheinyl transferase superfamily protein [Rouxiella chamberiensis]WAT01752.1 4'-phosphopantetheinyl transferase superfamily protein [Rouxiella chamberiensis]